jgi:HEAT repeat protein
MDVNKKLVAYHIGRLRDPSAEVRLKSIQELVELGDPDALEALQALYRTETNPELKAAAQDAGRRIFLQTTKKSL